MSTITGKVSQIIGPVIDVEFNTENGALPKRDAIDGLGDLPKAGENWFTNSQIKHLNLKIYLHLLKYYLQELK